MHMTPTRNLADADVFPIGLGGMPMSLAGRPPEERSIRTIHAALDAGVNLIDTADAYSRDDADIGHNERLIAKALRGRRDGRPGGRPEPALARVPVPDREGRAGAVRAPRDRVPAVVAARRHPEGGRG